MNAWLATRQLSGPPVAPDDLAQDYDSYTIDPQYARRFTTVWCSLVLLFIIFYLPAFIRSFRTGRIWQGWSLYENLQPGYVGIAKEDPEKPQDSRPRGGRSQSSSIRKPSSRYGVIKGIVDSFVLRSIPHTGLDMGQVLGLLVYLMTLLLCVTIKAPLRENPNRAGFLSLAQLPFIFIFGLKASPLTLLFGRGYEKLNFIHRWAGRILLVTVLTHGSIWINNRIRSGQANRLWTQAQEQHGIAALVLLICIVLSSLRPVRRFAYDVFYAFHVVSVAAFFIVVCYHTTYAAPWIYPPVAFYAYDLLVRSLRIRLKDAYLEAPDNGLTFVHIPDVSGGWIAGQHIKLRIFFRGRIFESHPLTIFNAPPTITNFKQSSVKEGGIVLAARTVGDWTKALNKLASSGYAEDEGGEIPLLSDPEMEHVALHPLSSPVQASDEELRSVKERRVSVLVDGPYGGSAVDFAAASESILLFAGGSGVTFTLGLLDDIVGRIANSTRAQPSGNATPNTSLLKTRRITFVWCVRSFGQIHWFSRYFMSIAKAASDPALDLQLDFRFFVTCLCDPESLPKIPRMETLVKKPVLSEIINDMIDGVDDASDGWTMTNGGGLGVAASGPERLTTDVRNAVATIGAAKARKVGGIELHTEAYCL